MTGTDAHSAGEHQASLIADGPGLRTLRPDEIKTYERDGYVVIPDIFSPAELATIDAEIDRLIDLPGVAAGPKRQGWIYDVRSCSEVTRRFAEGEDLLALVKDVVFPGIAIHSSKLVTKMPNSGTICHWHQDEAFYRDPNDTDTHSRTRMSVWVPLQDSDERNGCLWVVPGSNHWGLEDYTLRNDGTCSRRINRYEYAEQRATPLPVRAGSVVLFNAYTWHHSKNNATDRLRRAFIVSYQEATVPKGHAEQWRILVNAQ